MALPDPALIRTDPCPPGWHYEWVLEAVFGWLAWRVVAEGDAKQCRDIAAGKRCTNTSVAMIQRGRSGKREQWWHYCPDHMFGRRVDGQRVWVINTVRDGES